MMPYPKNRLKLARSSNSMFNGKYETAPNPATAKEPYSADLFSIPIDSCVIPNATPMLSKDTTTIPKLGARNHPVTFKNESTTAVAISTETKTVKVRFRLPLIIPAQNTPTAAANIKIQIRLMLGADRKLLNAIAIYSLRSTATQKTGSENIRKATNVVE